MTRYCTRIKSLAKEWLPLTSGQKTQTYDDNIAQIVLVSSIFWEILEPGYNKSHSLSNLFRTFITTKRSDFSNRQERSLLHSNYIHACIRMTNFSITCTPPSNYMHICTKGRKVDVILDLFFFKFQNVL